MPDSHTITAFVDSMKRDVRLWSPVDGATLDKLASRTFTPAGGVFVCHHLPAEPDGSDYYRAMRGQNPGMTAYVGYTVFETDSIPEAWIEPCNDMDEIWVPSRFNVETFYRAGVRREKLHVIPHGFDPKQYRPSETRPLDISEKRKGFSFLSIFEWTHRKGWDVLIKAYLEEFSGAEDVRLILRTYQGGGVVSREKRPVIDQLIDYIHELGYDPEKIPDIEFIDRMIPSEQMPALYMAADAYVMPTRGEGWGIPFTESMLMQVPVIATRWSGHTEFMNDENSYMIDINGLVPVGWEQVVDSPFYKGHCWADPSVEHTRAQMRHVFENRAEAREKGRAAREHILNRFTTHHAAARIAARVQALDRRKIGRGVYSLRPSRRAGARGKPSGGTVKAKAKAKPERVLFCTRPDLVDLHQRDTNDVYGLKKGLERLGVKVDITCNPGADLDPYDLVHIMCLDEAFAVNAALHKKPYTVTPHFRPSCRTDVESMKMCSVLKGFCCSGDEAALVEHLDEMRDNPVQDTPLGTGYIFKNADAVFFSDKEECMAMKKLLPGGARTHSVGRGIDLPDNLSRVSPELFVSKFKVERFVLCTGRITPGNNQLMLMLALMHEDVPVVFADSGANVQQYEELCKEFKRKGETVFTGRIKKEMLFSAYLAAGVHVNVGWDGLLGAETMEACALGCRVVVGQAAAAAANPCKNVYLCDPASPDSIKEAVMAALGDRAGIVDPVPPDGCASWDETSRNVLSFYREIVENACTPEGGARLEQKAKAAGQEILYDRFRLEAHTACRRGNMEGMELASKLSQKRPDDPLIWFILGSAYQKLSNHQEAQSCFEKSVTLKPVPNPRAYLNLAFSLIKQDKNAEAAETMLRALDLHPFIPEKTSALMYEYLKKATRKAIRKPGPQDTRTAPNPCPTMEGAAPSAPEQKAGQSQGAS